MHRLPGVVNFHCSKLTSNLLSGTCDQHLINGSRLLDKRKTCSACGGIGHNKRTCTEVPYKVTQEAVAAEILPRTSRAKKRPTFHDEFLDDPLRHQKKQSGGRMAARTGIQQQPRQQQQQEEKEHKLKQKQQQKLKQKQAIETANVTFDAEVDDAEEIFTSSRFVGVEWNPQEKMWQAR